MDGGLLANVRAYVDFQSTNILPFAGGWRDQSPALVRDFRIIAAAQEEARRLLPKR